MNTDKNRTARF